MKLSEVVQEVIRLGDSSRAYWDRELPKHYSHYPLIGTGEDSPPPPPEEAQIQALLKNLPDDELYALALVAYIGRGDFRVDDLSFAKQSLRKLLPSRDLAIAQLVENAAIAEYLTDGMEVIEKRHIDLETLPFANTVALNRTG